MALPGWTADQAATVQALTAICQAALTIIALALAIGVPSWQRRQEQRQREADRTIQARTLAWLILGDVQTMMDQTTSSTGTLEIVEAPNGGPDAAWRDPPKVMRPVAILESLDRLHLLGPIAAVRVMQVMVALARHDRATEADERAESAADLTGRLTTLRAMLQNSCWDDTARRQRWWRREPVVQLPALDPSRHGPEPQAHKAHILMLALSPPPQTPSRKVAPPAQHCVRDTGAVPYISMS